MAWLLARCKLIISHGLEDVTVSLRLFSAGSVYSPADPFASALLVKGAQVEWVGSDAGARSIADSSMQQQDLQGQLLTPAFALASAAWAADGAGLSRRLSEAGYGLRTWVLPEGELAGWLAGRPWSLENLFYLPLGALLELLDQEEDVSGVVGAYLLDDRPVDPASLQVLAQAGLKLMLLPAGAPEASEQALSALGQLDPDLRRALAPRYDGLALLSASALDLAAQGQVSLGFISDLSLSAASFKAALAAGLSVTLGADGLGPVSSLGWDLVAAAVEGGGVAQHAVSARGAFQAMTRGIFRALGRGNPFAGQLVPSAPAHYACWQVEALMVQTPDSRISAWSTDPRGRTPLLPALGKDLARPQLTGLFFEGEPLVGF